MTRRIIQFWTSRFLQAHVDLFVHESRAAGHDIGPISVIKTTPGAMRASRIHALRLPGGFPVRIRGYRDGQIVNEEIRVQSIDQALIASEDWAEIIRLFAGEEARIAVSNVGDRGYEISAADLCYEQSSKAAPGGFCRKLTSLLLERFKATGTPLLILPRELVRSNGQVLRGQIDTLAAAWCLPSAFTHWLDRAVIFANTLVDRIVAEEIEPVGAIAEPYALWAIEERGFKTPIEHPAIVGTDDLEPFERLKLHILNLGHTVLAEEWMIKRRPAAETVAEILSDQQTHSELVEIYAEEVIPGFAAMEIHESASRYVVTTIERFRNSFLKHRMSDIADNHAANVNRRVRTFLTWVRQRNATLPLPRLTALAAKYS